MDKTQLRKLMSGIRRAVTDKDKKDAAIFNRVISMLALGANVKIFSYISMSAEVDTFALIEYYIKREDSSVYIPRTKNGVMELIRAYLPDLKQPDKHGNVAGCESREPYNGKIDVAIVPLLAFNQRLYRLGYGGGFYDRFLSVNKVLSVGLAYDEQMTDELVPEPFDVPLDIIVTPSRIIRK